MTAGEGWLTSERARLVRELGPEQLYERFWRDLYASGEWEPQTRALIEETLRPGDLFLDVGAWIGPVTLWALERGARAIAVEPDPVALAELRRRVPSSVEVWEGAIAVRPGRATLRPAFGLELGKSVSRLDDSSGVEAGSGEVEVRAWTLPEVLAERIPNLVKIDIEGYEIELLPSIAPHLAERRVPMQVAMHGTLPDPGWFDGYGTVQIPDDPHGTVVALP